MLGTAARSLLHSNRLSFLRCARLYFRRTRRPAVETRRLDGTASRGESSEMVVLLVLEEHEPRQGQTDESGGQLCVYMIEVCIF